MTRKQTNHRPGRLGVWNDELPERAFSLCARLGATNEDLSIAFGVGISTIENWLLVHEKFSEKVKEGRDKFDNEKVEKTLLQRALGYTYLETHHIKGTNAKGQPYNYTRKVKKQVSPDITAIIFWLKNRHKERWADVSEHHHRFNGKLDITHLQDIPIEDYSQEEKEALFILGMKQITDGSRRN